MKKITLLLALAAACSIAQAKEPTLFVQQAKSAIFTPEKNNCYSLTLIQPKKRILYFASAPETDIGYTNFKTIMKAWKKGNELPNAAFSATDNSGSERNYAFKISNPGYNKTTGRITYTVCALNKKRFNPLVSQVFNGASVFIDPFHNWPP